MTEVVGLKSADTNYFCIFFCISGLTGVCCEYAAWRNRHTSSTELALLSSTDSIPSEKKLKRAFNPVYYQTLPKNVGCPRLLPEFSKKFKGDHIKMVLAVMLEPLKYFDARRYLN